MPNITFANIKGGSGKTTAAQILASELYAAGARVCILEGDQNRPHARWAKKRGFPVIDGPMTPVANAQQAVDAIMSAVGDARYLVITTDGNDNSVLDWIEAASGWAQFVLSDPEGSPNQWMTQVVSQADIVLIPFAPTHLDVDQVQETIRHIRTIERMANKQIDYRVLLTRANAGAVRTRDEREIRESIERNGKPMMSVSLADRPAFRGVFKHNVLLAELTADQAGGLSLARENARAYAAEVLEHLRAASQENAA
ncbi:ParA family protein [Brevundimonas sp. CEF1]|uniref:ParA family protein n=1 Tax=Brevundimonas sp. CEF1 TaxID=3442642 RepID=UPI003F5157ED